MTLDLARMFDAKTVAELLDCSERTVRRRIADGTIPSVLIGGLRRVHERVLEGLMHGHRTDWSDAAEGRETNDSLLEFQSPRDVHEASSK